MAQTRILYNEQQLHQLIYQHLLSKGFTESAATLLKEANLESPTIAKSLTYQPFHYRSPAGTTVSLSLSKHFFRKRYVFYICKLKVNFLSSSQDQPSLRAPQPICTTQDARRKMERHESLLHRRLIRPDSYLTPVLFPPLLPTRRTILLELSWRRL